MAEDKPKKKIDLKARLGKTAIGLQAPTPMPGSAPPGQPAPPSDPNAVGMPPGSSPGSAAPPSSPSQIPQPARSAPVLAPPPGIAPGLSPGIPLPPFGPRPSQREAPAPKPTAAQQTIKVDVGEEVALERAKFKKRAPLILLAGVIVGGGIAFFAGQSKAQGDRVKAAARDALVLEKSIKEANAKMKELDEKLTAASEKLKGKSYPEDLAKDLAGLKIPFETSTLDNKQIGGLPQKILKPLLNYTAQVEDIDKARETLKNLLGIAKEPINKAWAEEKAPKANFSVIFRSDSGKIVADLVPNAKPFTWKEAFPDKYSIQKTEGQKQVEKSATRFTGKEKDITGGSDTLAIPVDPKSMASLTGEVLVSRLSKALYDLRQDLEGNAENPQNPVPGMLKVGDDLANDLHKFSAAQ